jgi:hypothetical protein
MTNAFPSGPSFFSPDTAQANRVREAYERRLPEMVTLSPEKLVALTVEVPAAVATALGAWDDLVQLREQVATLPGFSCERFDAIEDYALALAHSHAVYLTIAPPADVAQLREQALRFQEKLLLDAAALSRQGFLEEPAPARAESEPEDRALAFRLLGLAALLRASWPAVAAETALGLPEMEIAERLASRLLAAVDAREQPPVIEAFRRRQEAFSLLAAAYDQARRAVGYLRWNEGDSDLIAPPLGASGWGSQLVAQAPLQDGAAAL